MTITQILTALASAADGEAILSLEKTFYPVDCLADATAAFADHCTPEVIDESPETFALRLRVAEAERQRAREVVGSFLNYLLCVAARHRQAAGTTP